MLPSAAAVFLIKQFFMTFKELNISAPVMRALAEKGYEEPSPIQQQAIPVGLMGKDIMGLAQTGTGKTAAFAIPIIEQLVKGIAEKGNRRDIKALILTPARELAIQINDSFTDYAKYTPLRHTVIYGGVNQNPQVRTLKQGVDILVATPGRLLDLIGQNVIHLDHVTHFVLDEADRMLDMGFIHDIKKLATLLPKQRQTMLFSATMTPDIEKVSKMLSKNPVKVAVTPVSSVVDTIEQRLFMVEKPQKTDLLFSLLQQQQGKSVLIFSRTKHGADKIAKVLNKHQVPCEAIHGNKSQNARQNALNDFKSGRINVIVATDLAARGLDIQDLGVVINYDLPEVPETYVHRIGRTGRAGNSGLALSFCSEEEQGRLRDIQRLTGKKIQKLPIPV
jgi:ATP-dependent RNA helicase RhlE